VACSTVLFHASLPIAVLLQFWFFIPPRYSLTASSHLNFRLPIKEKICPVPRCLPKVLLEMANISNILFQIYCSQGITLLDITQYSLRCWQNLLVKYKWIT
jgi:hypothetical protein